MSDTTERRRGIGGAAPPRRLGRLLLLGLLVIGVAAIVRLLLPRRQPVPDAAVRLAALQEEVRLAPGDLNARWALARALAAQQDLDGFIVQVREITRLDPDTVDAWGALGEAYVTKGDGPTAESVYREMLRRAPKAEAPYHGLTLALGLQRRYRESVAVARRGLKQTPKSTALKIDVALGSLRYASEVRNPAVRDSYYRLGIEELDTLAQSSTESGLVFYYLGQCYLGVKENDEALRTLQRAANLMANDPRPLGGLARAYQARGERQRAIEYGRRVTEMLPQDPEAHAYLGELLANSADPKEKAEAFEAVKKAAALDPTKPRYKELLGAAYARNGKLEEALRAYSEVVQMDPHRSGPYQQITAIYTRLGKADLATTAADAANKSTFNETQLKYLEQQAAVHPRNVSLRLQLADRYREIRQPALALDEYLQVLEVDPGVKKAREAVKALRKELTLPGAVP
jgi:tetratricopeptide (TPR) repeat protein